MKFVLFIMLLAFSTTSANNVRAQDSYLDQYAPSAKQVTSVNSQFCVQDNIDKCAELGYTQTSCPAGGVACPFDKTKFNCIAFSCADLGLLDSIPADMTCVQVGPNNPDIGIGCFKCQCGPGYINPKGCNGIVETLMTDKTICAQLGYINSVTDCVSYLPCPSDANKVRCLDTLGCVETKQTGCIQKYEVPEKAIAVFDEIDCDCGGKRSVIVDWNCPAGYLVEGSKENGSCIEINCPAGESENTDVLECSTDAAIGWEKVAKTHTGAKQCYECQCHLPDACAYTDSNKGEYGRLENVCCDVNYNSAGDIQPGAHYTNCVRACPTDVYVPQTGAVKEEAICEACGESTTYIKGWHCNEAEGFTKSSTEQSCNPVPCPGAHDGFYYSLNYTSEADCRTRINAGAGWAFQQEGAMSGGEWCGLCKCPYGSDDAIYKWSTSDTDNQSDAELVDLGCNGKYKECRILPNHYQTTIPEHVPAGGYNTRKICGQVFYQITKCEEGFVLSEDDSECLPKNCEGYNITGECPTWGNCSKCNTGGEIKYRLNSCNSDNTNLIQYAVNAAGTACCQKTCDPDDPEFFLGETCPNNKPTLVETKQNGCGDTCIKCM